MTLETSDVDARVQRLWLSLAGMAVIVLAAVGLIGSGIARSVTRPVHRLRDDAARFAQGDLSVDTTPHDGPPEIKALGASLDAMAVRLDELLRTQRAFVADASHQLRTPLTALRLRLENLEATLPGARSPELDAAIEETDRLANLVTELLSLARADEHRAPVVVDLGPLVRDRVDTWSAVADSAGVELALELDDDEPCRAWTTPGAVEQVLDNLLDNAIKASSPGRAVTVRLGRLQRTLRIDVVDHGPGLDDNQKTLALQRFWRADARRPGTGLGLSIVDAIAASSGGSFALADTPGGGLTASVIFRSPPGQS
jgi:signal transduction histidine kinase